MAIGAIIDAYRLYYESIAKWNVKTESIRYCLRQHLGYHRMGEEPGYWMPSLQMNKEELRKFLTDLPHIAHELEEDLIEDNKFILQEVRMVLGQNEYPKKEKEEEEAQRRILSVFENMLDVTVNIRLSSLQMSNILQSKQGAVIQPIILLLLAPKLHRPRNVDLESEVIMPFKEHVELHKILTNILGLSESELGQLPSTENQSTPLQVNTAHKES